MTLNHLKKGIANTTYPIFKAVIIITVFIDTNKMVMSLSCKFISLLYLINQK